MPRRCADLVALCLVLPLSLAACSSGDNAADAPAETFAPKPVASAQADLSVKPRLWVVVQSYDSADERPLFG